MRELALMDYVSGINHARREGMQEGMVIGKQEGMVIGEQKGIAIGKKEALSEYVFKLSGKGKSIEEICELTDLSVEEVKEVLNNRE
jgi:predicted transposase YdaD